MKGRLGSLAMLIATVLVALLALPAPAGAAQGVEAQGVPFDLPQFGLQILDETGKPAEALPLDLIGQEVATCFQRGTSELVCRLKAPTPSRTGLVSSVPKVSVPLALPEPAAPKVTTRGCYEGACPVVDPVSPWLSETHGLCTFCSDTHSVGTTSAIRLGAI